MLVKKRQIHNITVGWIKKAIEFEKSVIDDDLNVDITKIDGYDDMCVRTYNINAMMTTLKTLDELKEIL